MYYALQMIGDVVKKIKDKRKRSKKNNIKNLPKSKFSEDD
jgi:hypothetical protein